LTELQEADVTWKPIPPEEDKEWLELVRCGYAGDEAETKEQQKKRYETKKENSIEIFPALAQHTFRAADLICTCGQDYTIRTFDTRRNYEQRQLFEGHFNFVNQVVPYRGTMIVSASDDCSVRLWQLGEEKYGELLMTYYINQYPTKCVCVVPGQRFCCGGLDKVFRIVSFITGLTLMRLADHGEYGPDTNFMQKEGCGAVVTCLHIRQNLVCTGSDDSTVRFWDIDKGKCIHYEKGHSGYGRDIGEHGIGYKLSEGFAGVWKVINLGDDGKHVCSCSYDRTVTVWNVEDSSDIKVVRNWRVGDNGVLHVAAVGPEQIATSGGDKDMKIWNWKTGELLHTVRITRGLPMCVGYVDKSLIALCGGDCTIRIIDWSNGPKDLMGESGFYAHDFIINDCVGIFFEDNDADNWTIDPIMYCTTLKEEGEKDALAAIQQHRTVLQEAIDYKEMG
jgi:WD40 repeat protein